MNEYSSFTITLTFSRCQTYLSADIELGMCQMV